ncbi:hypothetical protein GQX73_g8994 [Xylaria multiplex]|uniref:Uncharacterized protein n=1 Tax=Xylaria multiplex TaxID=323545 RepID=A0A7C8MM13_9PEZI|nr:hypothetical protein GQX73_g8994 [Xylaria multiplex]
MSLLDRDDSISPMTKSSEDPPLSQDQLDQSTSDLHLASVPTHHAVPVRDLPISPSQILEFAEKLKLDGLHDYPNQSGEREPQESHSPQNESTPTTPGRLSPIQVPPVRRNNLVTRVPDQDDIILDEPASPSRRSVQFAGTDTILEPPPFTAF